MIKSKKKKNIISEFQTHGSDTGSAEVQIGVFSANIESLIKHLKKNPKDNSSRRGLLGIVNKRKKLLDYLKKNNPKRYGTLIKKLGLKK